MSERGVCSFNRMLHRILVRVFGVLLLMAFRRRDSALKVMLSVLNELILIIFTHFYGDGVPTVFQVTRQF